MKKFVLVFVLFICSSSLLGQTLFEEHTILESVFLSPYYTSAEVDLNADGIPDIISSNQVGMVYYIGNGESYDYPKGLGRSASLFYQTSYDLVDVDLDGDLDVVSGVVQADAPIIDLYRFNSTEDTFDSPLVLAIPEGELGGVIFHDLDTDGLPDVVYSAGEPGNYAIYWMRNNDGVSFAPQELLVNSTSLLLNLFLSDFDLDGDADLFVKEDNSGFGVLENTGAPNYFTSYELITAVEGTYDEFVISDINSDGFPDIIGYEDAPSTSQRSLFVVENMDGSGWGSEIEIDPLEGRRPRDIVMVDIDQDGHQDIVINGSSYGPPIWFRSLEGTGSFSSRIAFDVDSSAEFWTLLVRYDSTGGFKDLVGFPEGKQYVYDATEENLILDSLFPAAFGYWYYFEPEYIDMDNDGDLDFIPTRSEAAVVAIYENDGFGNYPEYGNIVTDIDFGTQMVTEMKMGASNNDDLTDVFYLERLQEFGVSTRLNYLENQGGLSFSSPQNVDLSAAVDVVGRFYVYDIDNDGDSDLLFSNNSFNVSTIVEWYYVENIDSFTGPIDPVWICTDCRLEQMNFADLNTDGLVDAVFYIDNQLQWFENNGTGGFEGPQMLFDIDELAGRKTLDLADLNNDGNVDVLFSSSINSSISWLNNMDGTATAFERLEILQDDDGSRQIAIHDVNFDGLEDVISVSYGNMVWHENLGDNTFSLGQNIVTGPENTEWPIHVTVANIDEFSPQEIIITTIDDPSSYDKQHIRAYSYFGFDQNEIQGAVTFDVATDDCDAADPGIPGVLVRSEYGTESQTVLSSDLGYIMSVPSETVTTSIVGGLPDYMTATPDSYLNTLGGGEFINANFCVVSEIEVNDLSVNFVPTSALRPGREARYMLSIKNMGTTAQSGVVSLTYPAADLSFLNATTSPTLESAGLLEFDFTDLLPFQSVVIRLEFQAAEPPELVLGDFLEFLATVTGESVDATPENNEDELIQEATDSFDPNDMTVLEGAEVHIDNSNEYLNYVIRFQNLGTAEAIDVKVLNPIDPNMDWTTLELMDMSHPGVMTIENDQIISFQFDDINLPYAQVDEKGSQGYITYKIKPKEGIQVGEAVSNLANIFFDFNAAITTNTVTTTYVQDNPSPSGVVDSVRIFPNPSQGIINLQGTELIQQLNVFNELGQLVWKEGNQEGISSLDLSSLGSGIYLAETFDRFGARTVLKLVIQ